MPAPDSNVPPGAGERRFIRHHARRRLGLDSAGPDSAGPDSASLIVLHRGPMAPRSGIDTIILGLGLLQRRHGVSAALLAVEETSGDPGGSAGAERARLRQLARELGIETQVHFMAGDSSGDCLAASDVLVSMPWCPRRDAARPAAMCRIQPAPEPDAGHDTGAVIDGVTGWLIRPRDAEALADRLARLQRHASLAPTLRAAGLSWVPA